MKYINYCTILCISILLFAACEKEELTRQPPVIIYEAGNQENGWATGTKEGEEWEASGLARRHADDSLFVIISFHTFSNEGALRENIVLSEIPLVIGKYEIQFASGDLKDNFVRSSGGVMGSDGDVAEMIYITNDDKAGFIQINAYHPETNTIEGEFELFFKNHENFADNVFYPAILEIENGKFEVEIIE